jgi:hypothetical protein
MKNSKKTVRIVCIVLAVLFLLSIAAIPIFYLLGK